MHNSVLNIAAFRFDNGEDAPLENLALLSDQLSPAYVWTPERRLLFAIVSDAIAGLQRVASTVAPYRLRRQAYTDTAWILSQEEGLFSFVWMCKMLDVDADYLRVGLRPLFVHEYPRRIKKKDRVGYVFVPRY